MILLSYHHFNENIEQLDFLVRKKLLENLKGL